MFCFFFCFVFFFFFFFFWGGGGGGGITDVTKLFIWAFLILLQMPNRQNKVTHLLPHSQSSLVCTNIPPRRSAFRTVIVISILPPFLFSDKMSNVFLHIHSYPFLPFSTAHCSLSLLLLSPKFSLWYIFHIDFCIHNRRR